MATEWSPSEADMVMYCDGHWWGLSFYCPTLNFAYYADITNFTPTAWSFFLQSPLCPISTNVGTWLWFTTSTLDLHGLMNTIEMFNSLKANKVTSYNACHGFAHPSTISWCVFHITGTKTPCWCPLVRITQCSSVPSPDLIFSFFGPHHVCQELTFYELYMRYPGNQFTLPGPMSTYSANMLLPLVHDIEHLTSITYTCTYNCNLSFENFITTPPTQQFNTLSFYMSSCVTTSPCLVNAYLSGICNTLEPHFPDVWKLC